MTLLKRWDECPPYWMQECSVTPDEIRRALAIAQAVEEYMSGESGNDHWIMRRADELLKDGK